MSDLISRQAAIDAVLDRMDTEKHGRNAKPEEIKWTLERVPSAQPEWLTDDDFETIRIHLNAYKEKLCNQRRWKEAEEYQRIIDRFMAFTSAQPEQQWIPVADRLPEERDWYLGIFKEPDTGWINPLPFICDYLLGTKTKATTKEGWILRGFTDSEAYIDYYFNLECVAWMPLPEPYKGGK